MELDSQQNIIQSVDWPPSYQVRVSQRCKHLQLKISPAKGLEVITPRPLSMKKIERFLSSKKSWILKHLPSMMPISMELPSTLVLPAIDEHWSIDYHQQDRHYPSAISEDSQRIIMMGNINDVKQCLSALQNWLMIRAERTLITWFNQVSERIALDYATIAIRYQRSRWGSCSINKSISLNAKLLLLQPQLVEHVMIHELCHTKELNHSAKFWALVGKHDVNYQHHRDQLKAASMALPPWAESVL